MSIDWDSFDKNVQQAIDNAADRTDTALAGRVASITRLTDAEVRDLFPAPADVQKLGELLKIVKNASDKNTRAHALVSNIESLATTVITLVEHFA